MRWMKWIMISVLLIAAMSVLAQDAVPKAETPVLVTSCGQSSCPLRFKVTLKMAKIQHSYNVMATADDLIRAKENGTPFKSLIITTGASMKGMGAAGVSISDELGRTKALIAEAKKQGIKIIGAHIGGMSRRSQGAAAGDTSDEQTIDLVMPKADFMVVRAEGNEDNRFTLISNDKNIQLVTFDKFKDLKPLLLSIFE